MRKEETDKPQAEKPSSFHDQRRRENTQKQHSSHRNELASSSSFWKILTVVLLALVLWRLYYQEPRYEIPIGKLLELVTQEESATDGEESRSSEALLPEAASPQDKQPAPTLETEKTDSANERSKSLHSIILEEGEGKKWKKVRYSDFTDLHVSKYEVAGVAKREVLEETKKEFPKGPREVKFFSGRQGLDVDAQHFLDMFRRAGYTDVKAKGAPQFFEAYGPSLIFVAIFAGFLIYFTRRFYSNAFIFGKSKNSLVSPEEINVSFQDVAGVDEAVEELKEIVDFLKTPERFQALGGRIPKGVLLVGPPGTGKTLLAKAVAGEANVPFFSLSGSDFVELYAGVGAARVRNLFSQAEQVAPAIVFIDELDALGKTRSHEIGGGGHDEREQTLNALLVEMDGFATNSGVMVMAATNRPETLDAALLRSGRFDRQVLIDRPDVRGREAILKIHSQKVAISPELNLKEIAALTSGFVGADLAALVNEATLLAARRNNSVVSQAEFGEAIERIAAGLEKKGRAITPEEKRRIAYHECGHALVAYLSPHSDPVHKISIIPRGFAALGYTLQRPTEDRYLLTQSELKSQLLTLLAGGVSEELFLGEPSTGAQNDLARATEIARNMVVLYGMSDLGKIAYRTERVSYLSSSLGTSDYSEATAREIDMEVRKIIESSHEETKKLLQDHEQILIGLATKLLEQETMDGEEMRKFIEEHNK